MAARYLIALNVWADICQKAHRTLGNGLFPTIHTTSRLPLEHNSPCFHPSRSICQIPYSQLCHISYFATTSTRRARRLGSTPPHHHLQLVACKVSVSLSASLVSSAVSFSQAPVQLETLNKLQYPAATPFSTSSVSVVHVELATNLTERYIMGFVSPLPLVSFRPVNRSTSQRPTQQSSRRSKAPRMLVIEAQSKEEMDKILKAAEDTLVIVDYSTSWCGPCKVFAPIFEEMSEKYKDAVFVKVMGDKNAESNELMKREGIRAVPAFHFWKNEKKVKFVTGARTEEIERTILSLK